MYTKESPLKWYQFIYSSIHEFSDWGNHPFCRTNVFSMLFINLGQFISEKISVSNPILTITQSKCFTHVHSVSNNIENFAERKVGIVYSK